LGKAAAATVGRRGGGGSGLKTSRAQARTDAIELASDELRVRFLRDPDGRHRFVTEVDDGGRRWPAASLPNVPVGGGLDLAAEAVELVDSGLRLSGARDVAWSGTVRPCEGGGLAFEATIDLAASLAEPPAIVIWLGPLATMTDRQNLTWRRSFVAGPVRNTQGLAGNTVPAAYLFDPKTGIETILHVDAGCMAWAPGRLLAMEMREIFEYGTAGRYGIGLVPSTRFTLAAGRHVFRWRLWQRRSETAPDGWASNARLVDTLAEGFDGVGRWPSGPVTWESVASGTVRDLLDADQVQVTVRSDRGEEVLGLRAYARDATHLYDDPGHFELMTLADVVPPLLLYLRLHPGDDAERFASRLHRSLLRFGRPEIGYIANRFPGDGAEPMTDTWYFFLNGLIKVPWVALIEADDALSRMALAGFGGAERLAAVTSDRLPLFAAFGSESGPRASGAASNASVAGLLAYAALLARELGNEDAPALARRLLLALRREPIELAFHEPLQLGFAAAAAALLADAGDDLMGPLADEFVRAQLRMLYWDEDPAADESGYAVRGMFEACASLLYPAFKENIEAILPWTELLRSGRGPTELMLKVMNLNRVQSLAFFDPLLPRSQSSVAPWIPYENLGTTELPGTGSIGKEVYGAGEGLWAYLLFEALGTADDPEILVVYTDLLQPAALRGFPASSRRFIAYNPTADTRAFRFSARALPPGTFRLAGEGVLVREAVEAAVPIELAARSWRTIDLERVTE
jgi:hypothetical protein